jgi:hypothetical protein
MSDVRSDFAIGYRENFLSHNQPLSVRSELEQFDGIPGVAESCSFNAEHVRSLPTNNLISKLELEISTVGHHSPAVLSTIELQLLVTSR